MGSNQFLREYINHLEDRNTELLNKLTHMKEKYENKIFSKDLSKHYLVSALEDILSACTALPQEIDLFFDKITAAMDIFKNILLRKSEMVQLVDKISRIMNPPENLNANVMSTAVPNFVEEQNPETKVVYKGGPVKVSPMINGHVISTTPRIYLSRISKDLTPEKRKVSDQLSPIVEASPDTSFDVHTTDEGKLSHQELRITLERLNFNKLSHNEDSPKGRFKGPKTWKKSLLSKKQQSDPQKSPVLIEDHENIENVEQLKIVKKDSDPLEGPSWLYDSNSSPVSNRCYIDYRRRKHRFASAFDMSNCFGGNDIHEDKSSTVPLNEIDKPVKSVDKQKENVIKDSSKEINETSEDFISESFSKDEDNDSSFQRKISVRDRKYIEESSIDNETSQYDTLGKKKVFASSSNRKSYEKSTIKSDSLYGTESEYISPKKSVNKSCSKRRSASSFHEVSMDITPVTKSTPEIKKEKSPGSEKKKTKNSKPKLNERSLKNKKSTEQESCNQSDECVVSKEVSKKSKNAKESLKNVGVSKLKKESSSPADILSESEGRKKRRAAPTNLTEPSLMTKLRRN